VSAGRFTREELLARARKPSQEALRLHPFYRGNDIESRQDTFAEKWRVCQGI
jgi:hypothetical protein